MNYDLVKKELFLGYNSSFIIQNSDVSPFNGDSLFGQKLKCFRVSDTFHLENPVIERVRGVGFQDRDRFLKNDRSLVVVIIHKMHGAS